MLQLVATQTWKLTRGSKSPHSFSQPERRLSVAEATDGRFDQRGLLPWRADLAARQEAPPATALEK